MKIKKIIITTSFLMLNVIPAKAELFKCVSCPAGTWSDGTACKSCLTTGVSACSATTGKPTACKPGYGVDCNCYASCANKSVLTRSICINACETSCSMKNALNPTCKKCSAGKYSTGGTASCKTCPVGYYCPDGTKKACTNKPSNSSFTSSATSDSCSWSCNSGYAKNYIGNKCCSTSTYTKKYIYEHLGTSYQSSGCHTEGCTGGGGMSQETYRFVKTLLPGETFAPTSCSGTKSYYIANSMLGDTLFKFNSNSSSMTNGWYKNDITYGNFFSYSSPFLGSFLGCETITEYDQNCYNQCIQSSRCQMQTCPKKTRVEKRAYTAPDC